MTQNTAGLLADAESTQFEVRCRAVGELAELREPEADARLIEALDDRQPAVRWRAAQAMARVPRPQAADRLIRLLSDENASAALLPYHVPGPAPGMLDAQRTLAELSRMLRLIGKSAIAETVEQAGTAIDFPHAVAPRFHWDTDCPTAAHRLFRILSAFQLDSRVAVLDALAALGEARALTDIKRIMPPVAFPEPRNWTFTDALYAAQEPLLRLLRHGRHGAVNRIAHALGEPGLDLRFACVQAAHRIANATRADRHRAPACTRCLRRTRKVGIRLRLRRYTARVCTDCGSSIHLVPARRIVGTLGLAPREAPDELRAPIWHPETRNVTFGDFDVLEIGREVPVHYDYALNVLWAAWSGSNHRKRLRQMGVHLVDSPPLSAKARRLIQDQFGPCREV